MIGRREPSDLVADAVLTVRHGVKPAFPRHSWTESEFESVF